MDFREWLDGAKIMVGEAFRKGINPRDASVLGYHGTSIQALEHLLDTGHLTLTKGSAQPFGGSFYRGRIYGFHIVPNPENPRVKGMEFRNPLHTGYDSPMDDALSFAKHIAHRHYTIRNLGLKMSRVAHQKAADDIIGGFSTPDEAMKRVKRGEPDPEAIQAGVVLAISERIADRFRIGVGADGNDINIETTKLPAEYIAGIEPADDNAFKWLDSLAG
jgi:hypothetical protein